MPGRQSYLLAVQLSHQETPSIPKTPLPPPPLEKDRALNKHQFATHRLLVSTCMQLAKIISIFFYFRDTEERRKREKRDGRKREGKRKDSERKANL